MGVAVQEASARRSVLGHALMFIAGFTLVFVALGATAGLLFGTFLQTGFVNVMVAIGGVLLLILGSHMLGVLKFVISPSDHIPIWMPPDLRKLIGLLTEMVNNVPGFRKILIWVDRKLDELILPERRKQAGYGQSPGYIRSGLVGMTFAAGWTPCIGPLLGGILGLALNAARATSPTVAVLQSAVLLFAYSMGLAIPFLLTAWILDRATGFLRRLNRHVHIIERISALLLIGLGSLLLFGSMSELNRYFASSQPDWIYQFEESLSGYGITLPIALLAGLLSFLSPCVLPLIPVYLGYLTGVAAVDNSEATA